MLNELELCVLKREAEVLFLYDEEIVDRYASISTDERIEVISRWLAKRYPTDLKDLFAIVSEHLRERYDK